MLDLTAGSALATAEAVMGEGVSITERNDFTLTQVAGFGKGFEKDLAEVVGKLPAKPGTVAGGGGHQVFRIAPQQFWVVAAQAPALPATCLVTPLSSSRCRIQIEGPKARNLLARCAAVDFSEKALRPGHFVMTGIHHTPVLIHCVEKNSFHIYAMRSFALSVWETLEDAAHGL
ncbi:MAG: hypothetical protein U1E15_14060 [Hyphomicrobiales bacterium]